MSEQGERIATLEAKVERMEQIENRLNELEKRISALIGGLAVLQVVIGIVLAFLKR